MPPSNCNVCFASEADITRCNLDVGYAFNSRATRMSALGHKQTHHVPFRRKRDDFDPRQKGARLRLSATATEISTHARFLEHSRARSARQTATTLDSWFRNAIETQPHTTAAVALGIGWLLGRMRRPLGPEKQKRLRLPELEFPRRLFRG